jgi:hypothetical protein
LGDEPLERKPFVVKLCSSKLIKILNSLKSFLLSNLKDPHSKGEEPYHLLRQELPINSVAIQSLHGGEPNITKKIGLWQLRVDSDCDSDSKTIDLRHKTFSASLPAVGRPDRCPMGANLQSAKVLQKERPYTLVRYRASGFFYEIVISFFLLKVFPSVFLFLPF